MTNCLIQADHAVFFFLNGMAASKSLMAVAETISDLGRYSVFLLAAVALALDGRAAFRKHVLAMLLILCVALAVNTGLKRSVDRARPQRYYRDAVARGEVRIQVGERLHHHSFPSGHSTLAFFALGYLALVQRRHAAWALALAAAVAWSRVAVGAHFPSDCLASAVIGLAWAWLAWRVELYLEKERWTKRNERKTPAGPSSGPCSAC